MTLAGISSHGIMLVMVAPLSFSASVLTLVLSFAGGIVPRSATFISVFLLGAATEHNLPSLTSSRSALIPGEAQNTFLGSYFDLMDDSLG